MNKIKPIVMIGLAMIIALFITILIYNKYIRVDKVIVEESVTQPIAVATIDLPWGTFIKGEHIGMIPFLKKSLPAGYFSDPNSANKLIGRTIVYPINFGEPILESRLAPITTKDGGVAVLIGEGKRAMAVKVDKVVGVAGFIYPRHRVDVLVSLREKDPEKRTGPITKTVLENIQVLAVGTEMAVNAEPPDKNGKKNEKAVPVDVITLEVSPEEGEKLALAATEGKIQLALRNCCNTGPTRTEGITIPKLLASCMDSNSPVILADAAKSKREESVSKRKGGGGKKTKQPRVQVQATPSRAKSSPFIVELVKGDKMSEVKFDKGI